MPNVKVGLEKPRFLGKVFRFFGFNVHPIHTILSVMLFCVNDTKTQKSQLQYEIKYDVH